MLFHLAQSLVPNLAMQHVAFEMCGKCVVPLVNPLVQLAEGPDYLLDCSVPFLVSGYTSSVAVFVQFSNPFLTTEKSLSYAWVHCGFWCSFVPSASPWG